MTLAERARRLLPGLWCGLLLCIATLATPAPFALLDRVDAGRVVGRILAHEAYASLALGLLLLVLERGLARSQADEGKGSQFSTGMLLALTALFCTILGYFALQPLIPAARSGQGPLSFGQIHVVSVAFFALKLMAVLALAWRAASAAGESAKLSRSASS